jgi:hypothetical protein
VKPEPKVLLPPVRQQLGDAVGRVVLQADQDVGQIDLGVDVVPFARRDQRVERR